MADTTIEWTDKTWNPVRGCALVSPGCTNCYAMKMAHRFSGKGQPYEGLTKATNGGPVWTGEVRTIPDMLNAPLRWREPALVFVNSMSDLFHPDVPDDFICDVFAIMARVPQHTFQILTKRPDRMRDILSKWARDGLTLREGCGAVLPNVWLGVSVEDQRRADERIPLLLATPAAVRFLSMEPLLGAVDISRWLNPVGVHCSDTCTDTRYVKYDEIDARYPKASDELIPLCPKCGGVATWTSYDDGIDWVIVGGESGHGARPMHPDWVRSLRDQCVAAAVPIFVKQLSGDNGKAIKDISMFPEDLRIREFPTNTEAGA